MKFLVKLKPVDSILMISFLKSVSLLCLTGHKMDIVCVVKTLNRFSQFAAGSFLLFGSLSAYAINYSAATSLVSGENPRSITSGDFDGVNGPDLAVVNSVDDTVSIFLNNGSGGYAAKVDYATGTNPQAVTSGNFNGDAFDDLAVVNFSSSTISVLLNNGDGTYAAKVDYATGTILEPVTNPQSVTTGDFNGDTFFDLAVTNLNSNSVSVFLNNGDGTYADMVAYLTGTNPHSVATGDFNGDTFFDLAVTNLNSDSVSVFLNNGDGTYLAKVDYTTGTAPYSVTTGDFDGVNGLDLAVVNHASDSVSVFLNDGSGIFAAKVDYTTGRTPKSVISGDFDGLNGVDLAVANGSSASVSIFLNTGNGTYLAKDDFTTGVNPYSITSGDFDGLNGPDLAVANSSSDTVSILLNIPDITPDAFIFTDQNDVALSTLFISNIVTLSGIDGDAPITVTGGEYSINGGAYTAVDGVVNVDDTVTVRHTSSASYATVVDTVLTIGGVSDTFSTTTITDTVPDAFSFIDQTGAALNTVTSSNTLTITGLGASTAISVIGGEYSINGAAYTASADFVNNDDTVSVRHTSSSNYETTTNTELTIGGVSDTFSVTTHAVGEPDPFSFIDLTGQALGVLANSNTIVVSGLEAPASITIIGGEYSINGGPFTAIDGTVNNNDTVVVRGVSLSNGLSTFDVVLTINGVSDTFSITTEVDTDGDGVGDSLDTDDDNDGIGDGLDKFPLDASEQYDTDGDGIGNNADTDDDGDGILDVNDAFPLGGAESVDTDADGIGDNTDTDDDGDDVLDVDDAFPLDPLESVDTDADGIGDNTDTDDDGDGVLDVNDAYPLDATRSEVATGGGGGGVFGLLSIFTLLGITLLRRRAG